MSRPSADAVAGNGAKRPLRRRRHAKVGMGGEAKGRDYGSMPA
jgi:hypothetical protein